MNHWKNLVTLYAALADMTRADVLKQFAGKGFGEFKPAFVDLAVAHLEPITQRMSALMADPSQIDAVLKAGNEKANDMADKTLSEVQDIMGFWR